MKKNICSDVLHSTLNFEISLKRSNAMVISYVAIFLNTFLFKLSNYKGAPSFFDGTSRSRMQTSMIFGHYLSRHVTIVYGIEH